MEDLTAKQVDSESSDIKPKGWKKPPALKDLQQDYQDAQPAHSSQKTKIEGWLSNLHITGKAKIPERKGFSNVQPKLIRKQAEWRYAALSEPFLSVDELFNLAPSTWEDVEAARQNNLLLNHQINAHMDKVEFIDDYVRAAVDEGTIIVRMGWKEEIEEAVRDVPEVKFLPAPQLAPLYQELDQMERSNPNAYRQEVPDELKQAHEQVKASGYPVLPRIIGWRKETYDKVVVNAPTAEVCDFRNVVIDPSCKGDFKKAEFVVYSFETSLSQLRKEGKRYKNLEGIRPDDHSPLAQPDHEAPEDGGFTFSDEARKKLVVHEYWGYWDYDGSGIAKPFVAAWIGNTMIRLEASPYPDKKLPFVVVPMLKVRNSVYGEPDGELLKDNQKIVGALMRGMIDIMGRSANGQVGIRKDALDAVNRRRFDQGKDYQYNAGVDPRMAFYMHTYPEIPQSASYLLDLQNNDAEAMTGVKAFANGITSSGLGDVATGIRGALDAASKRETGILRRLAKGMAEIGQKMTSMNQEFLDDEQIIRITNEDFVAIERDALAGSFDFKVEVSSIEEDNLKAQELAFMLQTMGPNSDPMIVMKILTKIARLRKMPDLAKEFESYQPQKDPMQEQLQQMELLEKQAKIAEINAKAQTEETVAILNQAKVITEQAKAKQLGSQADLNSLDFVEQESGVKQERDKELYGEQARSNIELEAFKGRIRQEEKRGENLEKYLSTLGA